MISSVSLAAGRIYYFPHLLFKIIQMPLITQEIKIQASHLFKIVKTLDISFDIKYN